jgi:Sulfotransferase family
MLTSLQTPASLRVAHWVGKRLKSFGVQGGTLSAESLIQSAQQQTGLTEFGTDRFRAPLQKLVESYLADRDLSVLGRAIARGTLVHTLVNRLLIARDLRSQPEIRQQTVERPLFVLGLPRTGTTFLYKLLTQDAQARPLLYWESTSPSPPPTPETRTTDPRIGKAEKIVNSLNRMIPSLASIHQFDAHGPEECLGLLMNTLICPFFRGRIAAYWDWLFALPDAEVDAAYAEYQTQLQLLQWKVRGEHWLLKCPAHLYGLGSLLRTFPNAAVVQLHRDPAQVVPSLCSLSFAMDSLYYAERDPHEVGRRMFGVLDRMFARGRAGRAQHPADRVMDVRYEDLIANPFAVVRSVYDRFGYRWSNGFEQSLRGTLEQNSRNDRPRHRYSLDDFGLSKTEVYDRLGE